MANAASVTAVLWMEALRERVDAALRRFLERQRDVLARKDPAAVEPLDELVRVIGAGGKRLRPCFCYWGYRAAGVKDGPPIVEAAASLELLHTFAVIHDDVMDRSPLRRGQPSTHRTLARGRDEHFGISAAILVGDLALTLADELFCESGFPPAALLDGFRWYNRMRAEVVAGQYLDLLAAAGRETDDPTSLRIAALKSGGYTVEKPLLIGGALAGAPVALLGALGRYGAPLGQAFQLRDDVLGAFGEPAVTGKDAEGDLREGKRTFLVSRARALATTEDRGFLDEHLGRADLSADDAERIRAILRSSGALAATLALIDELRARAVRALEDASLPGPVAAVLAELADLVVVRES